MLTFLQDLPSHLGDPWANWFSFFRVFKYITFRAMGAAGTAFLICLIIGPRLIDYLQAKRWGQEVRKDAVLAHHAHKQGTPTMGGIMIIGSICVATILWADPTNIFPWLVIATMIFMGCIGFYDDYLKVAKKDTKGLSARGKLLLQSIWMLIIYLVLSRYMQLDAENALRAGFSQATVDALGPGETISVLNALYVPFLKSPVIENMGWLTFGFMFLVLVGCVNAVNLTDGMDGLATGCMATSSFAYLTMAYAAGHVNIAQYLQIPYIHGVGELAVFTGALLGGCMGFLWFNCHPARVFMGDTGSLALGGALAMVAILTKHELVLVIVGGVFVMEAASVVLQVGYFKLSGGKRIFRCAPIHHHFELVTKERAATRGMSQDAVENRVVVRLWILALIFAMIGLATLKLR